MNFKNLFFKKNKTKIEGPKEEKSFNNNGFVTSNALSFLSGNPESIYNSHWLVNACVHKKSESASQVSWWAEVSSDGGKTYEKDVGLVDKFLKWPSPGLGINMRRLVYSTVASSSLTGRGLIRIVKDKDSGEVIEMVPVPPGSCKVTYKNGKKKYVINKRIVDKDDLIEVMRPSPFSVFLPSNPLQPAKGSIATDTAAALWQRSSLENAGMPTGIITVDEDIEDDDLDVMQKQIEELYSGPKNARSVAVFRSNNIDWKSMNISAAEMDFIKGRKLYREEICAVLDVPPTLVGIMENATLANVRALEEGFWINTIIPILDDFQEQMSRAITKRFGKGKLVYRVRYSSKDIPALADHFRKKIDTVKELTNMGVPFSVANEYLNLGVPRFSGDSISFMPSSVEPVINKLDPEDL